MKGTDIKDMFLNGMEKSTLKSIFTGTIRCPEK